MIFILNSPVLTSWGVYEFKKISSAYAKDILLSDSFESAVGHKATADFLSSLIGINIPVNRIQIQMKRGDKAIVFRLLSRLPEGKLLTTQEMLSMKEDCDYEFGLLTKIE